MNQNLVLVLSIAVALLGSGIIRAEELTRESENIELVAVEDEVDEQGNPTGGKISLPLGDGGWTYKVNPGSRIHLRLVNLQGDQRVIWSSRKNSGLVLPDETRCASANCYFFAPEHRGGYKVYVRVTKGSRPVVDFDLNIWVAEDAKDEPMVELVGLESEGPATDKEKPSAVQDAVAAAAPVVAPVQGQESVVAAQDNVAALALEPEPLVVAAEKKEEEKEAVAQEQELEPQKPQRPRLNVAIDGESAFGQGVPYMFGVRGCVFPSAKDNFCVSLAGYAGTVVEQAPQGAYSVTSSEIWNTALLVVLGLYYVESHDNVVNPFIGIETGVFVRQELKNKEIGQKGNLAVRVNAPQRYNPLVRLVLGANVPITDALSFEAYYVFSVVSDLEAVGAKAIPLHMGGIGLILGLFQQAVEDGGAP